MGKHEREQIKQAEEIIVKILNNKDFDSAEENNRWFRHAVAIAEQIKKDFRYQKAIHLGNRYDNTGDLMLVFDRKEIFIEIKMSDTKTGIGTEANISQDALTENGLFKNKTKSWSQFRLSLDHERWVNSYLDEFKKYPESILKITNDALKKEEKAKFLRKLSKRGNNEVRKILSSIRDRDRKEKIIYLNYLKRQQQQEEIIKRFLVLIILGVHTEEALKNLIKNETFLHEAQNLFIYYSNVIKDKRIVVHKEDAGEKVKKILDQFSDFKIIFPDEATHCKIAGLKRGSYLPLLQLVFHWKNIAQGIKTPCLNIFDLTKSFLD